ncbi:DUF6083 domain-containing protein [Streptomyces sp. NPDC048331]|uniref:DUF6083 domain-containing protein n=1 Tax=Streptomyces sp. NPDC048331 TaxID=3365534 RepID=UPI0037242639
MRIHPHAPSKSLRGDNTGRCLYCHNVVWWYDRADGGRIPLLPRQFPTSRVPPRARWSVDAGVARLGSVEDTCWIAHPTVCPGIEHEEFTDTGLADLHRQSAINMQTAIREGRFSAPLTGAENDDQGAGRERDGRSTRRDVVAYHSVHLLAPSTVGELLCVALSEATGQRCDNLVRDDRAGFQGEWAEIEMPYPRDPTGDAPLWEGQTMWVWSLNNVSYKESVRWRDQHCPAHAAESTTPDAHPRECEHFDPFRHSSHIRYQRPTAVPVFSPEPSKATRLICAGKGCDAGKVGAVPDREVVEGLGWMCYKCRPKHTARRATHRRWEADPGRSGQG